MVGQPLTALSRCSGRWPVIIIIVCICVSCSPTTDDSKRFELLPSSETGISFNNALKYTEDLNPYTYRNFFNGGGVGIGDINNDGLPDIYLAGNMVSSRLYLNKGDFRFEDITDSAGVGTEGVWTTGVSMVDINGDGLLDIYVCKSGKPGGANRHNEFFINNGDLTFSEKSKDFGLDIEGLSNHASFFDYDKDGDLDMYLLSSSFQPVGNFDLNEKMRYEPDLEGGDRLYRNEFISDSVGSTPDSLYFVDVTKKAGIYGSRIGFGLGVSAADINRDGWIDIYISNDFFERDYLYINNGDGTFSEELPRRIDAISLSSMGADIADINHDGYPEIYVTDMLPESNARYKTKVHLETWQQYRDKVTMGFHHQFTRNTLQLNSSDGTFDEIGRYANVEATDWSWAALIADFNLDGQNDLFVSNGIYKDLTDQDYVRDRDNLEKLEAIVSGRMSVTELFDNIPSEPLPNYLFKGQKDLRFQDVSGEWGVAAPGFSNGAAYGDLDDDGDLDLVVNNVNMESFVYRNRTVEEDTASNWLGVNLKGESPNNYGIGSQIEIWADGRNFYSELVPQRGFQSTVDTRQIIGLGSSELVDSLRIFWPDGRVTRKNNLQVNRYIILEQHKSASGSIMSNHSKLQDQSENNISKIVTDATTRVNLEWTHTENEYDVFEREPLLYHSRSSEGPAQCAADIDGNGLDDLYLGGAKGQGGTIWLQIEYGDFKQAEAPVLHQDVVSEDIDCVWFDADNDGDLDLYVASGGSEFSTSSTALKDRLYINTRSGWSRSTDRLPSGSNFSTGTVIADDFDEDGDDDLFIGARLEPFAYGKKVDGRVYRNNGEGIFTDVTESAAPEMISLGLITGASSGDLDDDGDRDLIIAGEWMPITVFLNQYSETGNLKFKKSIEKSGFDSTNGWWNTVALSDLDNDGDLDLVAGNHGLNSRFKAGKNNPIGMWVHDFDRNGTIEQIITLNRNGNNYPVAQRHELVEQLPFLEMKYPTYDDYKNVTFEEMFTTEQMEGAIRNEAYLMASIVGWNNGKGDFTIEELPAKAQFTPVYSLAIDDIDSDGLKEVLLGGNLYEVKPEIGRYDAGNGSLLRINRNGEVSPIDNKYSGFYTDGQIRSVLIINKTGRKLISVARNDSTVQWYEPVFDRIR